MEKRIAFAGFALLLLASVFVSAIGSPSGSVNDLKINEIVSDVNTGEREWVEIYNSGSGSVDLTGCKITDAIGTPIFLSGTMSSGAFFSFEYSSSVLNNAGDTVTLTCDSTVIDEMGYGDTGSAPRPFKDESTGRCPDGSDTNNDGNDFEVMTPTRGAANDCPAVENNGCLEVLNEIIDSSGERITPVPEIFTFFLNGNEQTLQTDSDGYGVFSNVAPGLNIVTEEEVTGWSLYSVTPGNGEVIVPSNGECVSVLFKNIEGAAPEPFCGDGTINQASEECDDGNDINGDGCSALCEIEEPEPFCGDGNLDAGEQCDDGNNLDGDGCSMVCEIEEPEPQPFCGDGIVNQASEQCDLGSQNGVSGSGCSRACRTVNNDNRIGVTINTEDFEPIVWMCDSRVVYDDNTEPGRLLLHTLPERINNYAYEGESIKWDVLVMDKNGIDKVKDVYATVGDRQGAGNDIEVNCQKTHPQRDFNSCNARILEEELTEFDENTMGWYTCTLTVETPDSMHGKYWITVEAEDLDGLLGTIDENERWFLNPYIALNINGDLKFEDVRPGTMSYSNTLLVGNDAEPGSGVMLDMFISGTDFYDSSSSGARCGTTNQLSLRKFAYFATNGAYNTGQITAGPFSGPLPDSEGYKGIIYGIGFNDPSPFYNRAEILPAQISATSPYYAANLLAPGAEMALTFRLFLPEPCNGDFDDGNIYFWGEAV